MKKSKNKKYVYFLERQQHTCGKKEIDEDLLESLVSHGLRFRLVVSKA